MKRYRALIAILLILGLGFFFVFKSKKTNFSKKNNIDIYANFELTGILREMDLDEEFKTNHFIENGQFQLTQLNAQDLQKLPFDANNLFIETFPKDLTDLIGKCVTIKGKLDTAWIDRINKSDVEDKFLYNGLIFLANTVDKNDFKKCDGYNMKIEVPTESKSFTTTGTIKRLARLVPDVGPYDYVFIFNEPYTSLDNSSGEPQVRSSMPIAPANNEVWEKIENKIDTPAAIEVNELWGYVESKYLLVTRVMD